MNNDELDFYLGAMPPTNSTVSVQYYAMPKGLQGQKRTDVLSIL